MSTISAEAIAWLAVDFVKVARGVNPWPPWTVRIKEPSEFHAWRERHPKEWVECVWEANRLLP